VDERSCIRDLEAGERYKLEAERKAKEISTVDCRGELERSKNFLSWIGGEEFGIECHAHIDSFMNPF
jgi:hypothetical protein